MRSAVESNQTHFEGVLWRAVEAQHLVSTMRLVDNKLDDQTLLEQLIETAKPPLPASTEGLHWLLAAPFRYLPPLGGSRFRGLHDPGVFYGARAAQTACAECGYWRWRFVRDSAGLQILGAHAMSVFDSKIKASLVNLRRSPFDARRAIWTDSINYAGTQAFAREARLARVQAILYESVRDPDAGDCVAVLSPEAFPPGQDPLAETWYLTVTPSGAVWQRNHTKTLNFHWAV